MGENSGDRVTSKQRWYVKRGEQIKGPFLAVQIQKYGALGRVRASDLLSIDQVNWRQAGHCDELFPAGRMDAMKLEPKDDERRATQKRNDVSQVPAEPEQVEAVEVPDEDRREEESPEVIKRREQRERVLKSLWSDKQTERFPTAIIIILVIVIACVAWFLQPGEIQDKPDCSAPAGAGVNWNNCPREQADLGESNLAMAKLRNARLLGARLQAARLDQADLSYANLMQANLGYASLSQAVLMGANLKFADLSNANLARANLAYADLTQANLGGADLSDANLENAIWINGQVCLKGSVGRCIQTRP